MSVKKLQQFTDGQVCFSKYKVIHFIISEIKALLIMFLV